MKNLLWLLVIPPWIYGAALVASPLMQFAIDSRDYWWGGFPLMAALYLPFAALCVAGIAFFVWSAMGRPK